MRSGELDPPFLVVASPGVSEISVPLVSRRRERAQVVQKLQHGLPSVLLLFEGLQRAFGEGDLNRWLGTAEAFTAMVVLGGIARAIGRLRWGAGHTEPRRHVHRHHIDWLDVGIAAMLFVEVGVHYAETQHWGRPTLLMAVIVLGLGLLHGRIAAAAAKRRMLRVTDDGIIAGGRLFSRFEAAWADIARIDIETKRAAIVRRDGRTHAFDLLDLRHSNDIVRALTRARGRLAGPDAVPLAGQAQES